MAEIRFFHKILILIVVFIGLMKLSQLKLPKFNNISKPVQQVSSAPIRTHQRERIVEHDAPRYVTIPSTPSHVSAAAAKSVAIPVYGFKPVESGSIAVVLPDETPARSMSSSGSLHIDSDAYNRFYR